MVRATSHVGLMKMAVAALLVLFNSVNLSAETDLSCGGVSPDDMFISGFRFNSEEYLKVDDSDVALGATKGVIGTYLRSPYTNSYHRGTITADGDSYLWRNENGNEWGLNPDMDQHLLVTDQRNPYYDDIGGRNFELYISQAPCDPPFRVKNSTYRGMTGHITNRADDATVVGGDPTAVLNRHSTGWGISWYSGIHTIKPEKAAFTQLGWGTWIVPNPYEDETGAAAPRPKDAAGKNTSFCPNGALPDNFQSLEGGVGSWGNVDYPVTNSLFVIAATSNCYSHGVGGPAYTPNAERLLADDEIYFAQLNNRMLLPPGAVTFEPSNEQQILGHGWFALPIVPENMSPYGIPTGKNSWTLLFHAENVKGPIGFFTPAFWTAVNAGQDPWLSVGYGLDTRGQEGTDLALEVGYTNSFDSVNQDTGVEYMRIPRMTFALDAEKRAPLFQDYIRYSKAAIFDTFEAWVDGGQPISELDDKGFWIGDFQDRSGGGVRVKLGSSPYGNYLEGEVEVATYDGAGGSSTFGLQWVGNLESGVIPEYYKKQGEGWEPISVTQVPSKLHLEGQIFPQMKPTETPSVDTSASSAWDSRKWAAGPFTTNLNDGSTVEYVWYRFIDQPALARLPLTADMKTKLQAWAESVHSTGLSGLTIPPPSSGQLVSVDEGLLVRPPAGLDRGYVPISIAQRVTPTADDNVFRLELEEPIVDAIHGGVGNLRGWAIADSGIEKVEIWLDDVYAFDVPYGGKRGDVSFAFSEVQDSGDSGFSMAYAYSSLSPGSHSITAVAYNALGQVRESSANFEVVKFNQDFLSDPDAVDLGAASCYTLTDGISITDAVVGGDPLDMVLRWRTAEQGFEIVEVHGSGVSATTRQAEILSGQRNAVAEQSGGSTLRVTLEEPVNAQIHSGVGNLRGWAVASAGVTKVEIYIDGEYAFDAPYGGSRGDVGSAFPDVSNSAQSGFSLAYTYSNLSAGTHSIEAVAHTGDGEVTRSESTFEVVKFKQNFISDPGAVNLSGANCSVSGDEIAVSNASVAGETYDMVLDWRIAEQGFEIIEIR